MKPILFNTEMVKAILNGRKTQTRRVIYNDWIQSEKLPIPTYEDKKVWHFWYSGEHKSKYGIGDILYVQEDWKVGGWNETSFAIDHSCEPYNNDWHTPNIGQYNDLLADILSELNDIDYPCNEGNYEWEKYKSPLELMDKSTMSKWMARIFLKVTNVRVERLQDISEEDCMSEGADKFNYCYTEDGEMFETNKEAFKIIWNSTAPEGYTWDKNPYVFVFEFERVDNDIE